MSGSGTAGDPGAARVLFAPRDLPPLRPDAGSDPPAYRAWLERHADDRPNGAEVQPTSIPPTATTSLALLIIVDRPQAPLLDQCLRAVTGQRSAHWELGLAVVGTSDDAVSSVLQRRVGMTSEWPAVLARCPTRTSAATAAARALEVTGAPAVMLVGQHDRLHPDAVALLGAALDEPGVDIAYGDEDELDGSGRPAHPMLKPDWSPELLLAGPYLGRPVAIRRSLLVDAGGLTGPGAIDWEHDLLLRSTERASGVAHVPRVLCHRVSVAAGPGGSGADGPAGGGGAAVAALARRGEAAQVEPGLTAGTWRVRRRVPGRPTVSVLVPFRDGAPLLRACTDSLRATVEQVDLELVLIDNGSVEPETHSLVERLAQGPGVTLVTDPRPFNWAALNNAAVDRSRGDVLVFLNNDIETRCRGWLEALCAQALRPDVGAVGARLLYPDGRVQHAGVVIGLGGAAGHVLAGLPESAPGYLGMAVAGRECSAVTGACLAVRRRVFDEVGRFDEALGLDLNDIDYCLRARRHGYRVIYEPLAELVHHESPSRGTSGSVTDIMRFVDRWEDTIVAGDPFLNPALTRTDGSCALAGPDERTWWREWRSTLQSA